MKQEPLPKPRTIFLVNEEADWPETAPILEAQHMIRSRFHHPDDPNCHCLSGHAEYWFGPLVMAVSVALDRRIGSYRGGSQSESIPHFNDDKKNSKELLARIWNATMADLGYTEGNPEA